MVELGYFPVDVICSQRYRKTAAAKSAAGYLNPDNSISAQHTRQRVFLCVMPAYT